MRVKRDVQGWLKLGGLQILTYTDTDIITDNIIITDTDTDNTDIDIGYIWTDISVSVFTYNTDITNYLSSPTAARVIVVHLVAGVIVVLLQEGVFIELPEAGVIV